MVKPFKVNISDQIIKDIYDKVKKYPWHEMPNDGGWEYGTNLDYMKEKAIRVPKLDPDFFTKAWEQTIKLLPISSLKLALLLLISSNPFKIVIPRSPSPIFPSAALNSS